MSVWRALLHRLRHLPRQQRFDRQLDEELQFHIETRVDELEQQGYAPPEARARAIAEFGSRARVSEDTRAAWKFRWLEDLAHDVRFALRSVRRTPLFAAVIVGSLALGIGANTALVSLIEATVVRDLPVEAPQELVHLQWQSRGWLPSERFAGSAATNGVRMRSPTFTSSIFDSLSLQASSLSEVFAFNNITRVNAMVGQQADGARMQLVSGDYFKGLRVQAAIGRGIASTDDSPSAEPAAVISYRFWQRRFGRNPSAVGTPVLLDGSPFTIVGVAPEEFRGAVPGVAERPDFWIPLAFAPRFGWDNTGQDLWWLSVMGRMRAGATIDQVRDNLAGTFRAAVLETANPPRDDVPALLVRAGRRGAMDEGPNDEVEHAVILGGIFGIVLLIVCLNVANLLLARSATRRTEIAVRLALGASRARLIRQLITESLCLAIVGGLVGLVLAYWGKDVFAMSTLAPRDLDLPIDASVFGTTLLVSAFAGLLFGVVPALRTASIRGGKPSLLNRSLLAAQVAISVVILVGAGLFARTLGSWSELDAGFETDNILVFQISPEPLGYDTARAAVLTERLVTRIRAIPGVVGATASGPFWEDRGFGRLTVEGETVQVSTRWLPVRHDFFATLRLPVLTGRGFLASEDQRPPDRAVIEERLARRLFGQSNPVGRRFSVRAQGRDMEMEVVGVAGNMWMPGTQEEDVRSTIYLPAATRPADFNPEGESRRLAYRSAYQTSIEVRTAAAAAAFLPAIRTAVAEIEPNLPLLDPTTVAQAIQEKIEPTRVVSILWLSFGAMALVLTAVGLYGLVACIVSQRTREIGIRTALGAGRSEIVRLVTGRISVLVALGLAIGLAASIAVNQLIRGYIFGVTFYDPTTIVGVLAILILATGTAAFLPARKASRVNPIVALRSE